MDRKSKNFKEIDDCTVIYTDNYLNDVEGAELEDVCDGFLKGGKTKIIIDFTNTELVNSIGISILIGIMERIRESQGVLFFSGLKKVNYDIFDALGLTKHIPVFKTEEEALKNIMTNALMFDSPAAYKNT